MLLKHTKTSSKIIMAKPRKKKSKIYFGTPAQDAIVEYNASTDERLRNKKYKEAQLITINEVTPNSWTTNIGGYFLCQSTVALLK
jgi:hypothetical protein